MRGSRSPSRVSPWVSFSSRADCSASRPPSEGFTTLVSLVLFLGGIQLIGIGVLGEYLGRVYDEVKRRPNYIVKRKTGCE